MSSSYAKRKLWSHKANLGLDENFAYEAYYAYSTTYPGALHPTPGRYRIRITRMPASEFLRNLTEDGSTAGLEDLSVIFTVQAFLEKWVTEGWIPCLDWMGDPSTQVYEIENELNEMFEAFTTGVPLDGDKTVNPFPFRPSGGFPKSPKKKTHVPPDAKPKATPPDDGFDWI